MQTTEVILKLLGAPLKKLKTKNTQVNLILKTFYFTKYIQNIVISTYNQCEKLLSLENMLCI